MNRPPLCLLRFLAKVVASELARLKQAGDLRLCEGRPMAARHHIIELHTCQTAGQVPLGSGFLAD